MGATDTFQYTYSFTSLLKHTAGSDLMKTLEKLMVWGEVKSLVPTVKKLKS